MTKDESEQSARIGGVVILSYLPGGDGTGGAGNGMAPQMDYGASATDVPATNNAAAEWAARQADPQLNLAMDAFWKRFHTETTEIWQCVSAAIQADTRLIDAAVALARAFIPRHNPEWIPSQWPKVAALFDALDAVRPGWREVGR